MYLDVRNVVSVEKYEEENLGVNPTPRKGHHKWVDAAVLRARLNQTTTSRTGIGATEHNGHGLRWTDMNDRKQQERMLTDKKDLSPHNQSFQSPRFRNTSTRYAASQIPESSLQPNPEIGFDEKKKDLLRNSAPRIQIPDAGCKISDFVGGMSQMSAYQRCQVMNKFHLP